MSTVVDYDNTPYVLDTSHRNSWTAFFPELNRKLIPTIELLGASRKELLYSKAMSLLKTWNISKL